MDSSDELTFISIYNMISTYKLFYPMIKTQTEFRAAIRDVEAMSQRIQLLTSSLQSRGLPHAEIMDLIQPQQTELSKLRQEIDWFLAAQEGEVSQQWSFADIGKMLIVLRIARGLTQKELAERLKVKPALISKDELREYQGLTVQRLGRILEALEAKSFIELDQSGKAVIPGTEPETPKPEPIPELELELELHVACKSLMNGLGAWTDQSVAEIDKLLVEAIGAFMVSENRKILETRRVYKILLPQNELPELNSKISALSNRASELASAHKCNAIVSLRS